MYCKKYLSKSGLMLAAADAKLIGKRFKFKDIEFHVNPQFYQGEKVSKEELLVLLKEAASANLVGKKVVACGIEVGIISEANIVNVAKDVPHALAVSVLA